MISAVVKTRPMNLFRGRLGSSSMVNSDPSCHEELRQIVPEVASGQRSEFVRSPTSREKKYEDRFRKYFLDTKSTLQAVVEARLNVFEEARRLIEIDVAPSLVDLSQRNYDGIRDLTGMNIPYIAKVSQLTNDDICSRVEQLLQEATEYSSKLRGHPNAVVDAARMQFYTDCRMALAWTEGRYLPHEHIGKRFATWEMSRATKDTILRDIVSQEAEMRAFLQRYE